MTPERERGQKCTQNMIERWWFHENQKRTTRESQQTNENDDKEIPMSCHQQGKQSFVVFVRQFPEGCLVSPVRSFLLPLSFEVKLNYVRHTSILSSPLHVGRNRFPRREERWACWLLKAPCQVPFEVEKRGGFEVKNKFSMVLLFLSVLIRIKTRLHIIPLL